MAINLWLPGLELSSWAKLPKKLSLGMPKAAVGYPTLSTLQVLLNNPEFSLKFENWQQQRTRRGLQRHWFVTLLPSFGFATGLSVCFLKSGEILRPDATF